MRTMLRFVVGLVIAGGLSIAAALPAGAQQQQQQQGRAGQQMQSSFSTMVGSPMTFMTFPFMRPSCMRRVVFVPSVFVVPTTMPMSSMGTPMMGFQLVRVVRMTPVVVCA